MKLLGKIYLGIALLISTPLRAEVNVLELDQFVLALDGLEVAYKRADASSLDSRTSAVAESVCQIKGYSKNSRYILASNFSNPTVWKVDQGALTLVPVTLSKPWVFVKKPQMSESEYLEFVKDLNFITSIASTATLFYATMISTGSLQRAWDRTDPWAGYALDANIWAAIEAAPWFLPRLKNCVNGVCRSWLKFEVSEEEAKDRIHREEPIYRYEVKDSDIKPRVFSEVWCEAIL